MPSPHQRSDGSAGASPSRADFHPTAHWETLRKRAELLWKLRAFFHERGFAEVETPLLSADTVVDRHIDPVLVLLPDDAREPEIGRTLFLQTSPEFHMKRLLAAGSGPMVQVTRSFRVGERGPRHNPEFTIVEWYRPGDDYDDGMALLSDLAEALLGRGPATRITYREAFQKHAGCDPFAEDVAIIRAAAAAKGVVAPKSLAADDRDGWLDLLLVECVESQLGREAPAILCDYPPSQAALAKVRQHVDGSPAVAERFELYVDGVELANGYHELLDPAVLKARIAENNSLRHDDGKYLLPETSRLLAAMEAGLPSCSGCALGFDRLAMVALGVKTIDEVLPFPIERA